MPPVPYIHKIRTMFSDSVLKQHTVALVTLSVTHKQQSLFLLPDFMHVLEAAAFLFHKMIYRNQYIIKLFQRNFNSTLQAF